MRDKQLKILLVDDSNLVLQRTKEILYESLPIDNIIIAKDGDDALSMIDLFQPHIILLDIGLPRKSGLEVLKIAKKQFSHVKIIMFTSQPADQYKDLCIEYGADAFIDKTNEFENIPSLVKSLMNM